MNMQRIKAILGIILLAIFICTGCTTIPSGGGDPVYDATKTEQVKAAIKPLVVAGVRRAIIAETNAIPYLQTVAEVFANARDRGEINPAVVARALDARLSTLAGNEEWVQIVLDLKNATLALYEIFYAERHSLQMPEDKWMFHVADVIANSFTQAIGEAQTGR
jgi:hypothetical protein